MPFIRPESIPYPSVWHRFERVTRDGKVRKFFVQDATPDMFPFILDHMAECFMRGEPMCKYLNLVEEPESVFGMLLLWRNLLDQKLAIVCFEEDHERPGVPFRFVGLNMCYAAYGTEDNKEEIIGDKWKIVFDTITYCGQQADLVMKPDLYLGAMGLSVLPLYQGLSIGKEILDARTPLCQACKIPITTTVFTNIASQRVAYKSNFKDIISVDYEDLKLVDPRFNFDIPDTKCIKVMYKEIELN